MILSGKPFALSKLHLKNINFTLHIILQIYILTTYLGCKNNFFKPCSDSECPFTLAVYNFMYLQKQKSKRVSALELQSYIKATLNSFLSSRDQTRLTNRQPLHITGKM